MDVVRHDDDLADAAATMDCNFRALFRELGRWQRQAAREIASESPWRTSRAGGVGVVDTDQLLLDTHRHRPEGGTVLVRTSAGDPPSRWLT